MQEIIFSFVAGLILLFIFFIYTSVLINKSSLNNKQRVNDLVEKIEEREKKLYEELDKLKESLSAKPKRNCGNKKC